MKSRIITADILYILLGSFLFAASVNVFTAPNNIVPGGLTGLGTIINYLTAIPIGTIIIVLNIPIFICAYKIKGFRYIAKTLAATLVSSVMIDITAVFLPVYHGDIVLTVILAGVLSGLGLSLIFMRGATTGGTDLIANLLSAKFRHIPIGRLILLVDFVIIALSAVVYGNIETPMYSTLIIFIMSRVIDGVLYGSSRGHGKMMFIISPKNDIIAEKIMSELERGVTIIPSKGAYTKNDGFVLLCAVSKQEVYRTYDMVYAIDGKAFIMVTEADEVIGEGFGKIEI